MAKNIDIASHVIKKTSASHRFQKLTIAEVYFDYFLLFEISVQSPRQRSNEFPVPSYCVLGPMKAVVKEKSELQEKRQKI